MSPPEVAPGSLEDIARQLEHGDLKSAEADCLQFLSREPDSARALYLLGKICRRSDRTGYAAACLESALRLQPADTDIRFELLELYRQTGNATAGAEQLEWCAALLPGRPELLLQLGQMHSAAGRYESALACFRHAKALGLRSPHLTLAFATTLHSLRRLDEAEPYFAEALKAEPEQLSFRWEYAMQSLLRGCWAPGWDDFEARFAVFGHRRLNAYPFPWPAWNGEPLAGKTLLIHGEQGLGDEIMFCSMVPEITAMAGRCIVACSPMLHEVFARSFTGAEVRELWRGDPERWAQEPPTLLRDVGPVDYQITMGSLPRMLRRTAESFRNPKPYLSADPVRVAAFNDRLQRLAGGKRRFRTGLTWSGNLKNGLIGIRKSIPIELFRSFSELRGVQWISLHQDDHGGEAARVPELGIIDFSQNLKTAADTAGLIANLDLVISVDTMTAHLAGAMGKPTWLPLWLAADWRWQWAQPTSLWYPDVQLFRQEVAADWTPVIATLKARLSEVVAQSVVTPSR